MRVLVEDTLAGIEDEKAINLAVDGQELIFEYNTHRNSLRHSLQEALSPGEHQLTVRAIDRVGNVASDTVSFFIR